MRMIDADNVAQYKFKSTSNAYQKGWNDAMFVVESEDHCHTIEAEPVRHGRWIHDINNLYGCSECLGRETMSHKKLKPYCPNCGAKMDGGAE